MRAFPTLWTTATLCLLGAAGCKTGSQTGFWPWSKTPAYSNWSKSPPADGKAHADPNLPSSQTAAPPYDPSAGYAGQAQPAGGATNPNNGYSPIDYNTPPGSAAANQGYAGAGAPQQGPYSDQQQTGGAAGGNQYVGAGQGGARYDQTADARYGNSASGGAGGAGYDTGSRYDTQANSGGDRYAPTQGSRYASPGGDRYAAPADRYAAPASGASDHSAGAPAGGNSNADPAYTPGTTDYVPGNTDYQPNGVPPYQSPAGPYRSNPNSPSSTWRPGGTKDYQSNNSGASTRAGLNGGTAAGGAQNVSYDAPNDVDNDATPAGGDNAPLGDRYSQPAATSAGGYGQNGGPVRR
ncbi:MAG TPA: hypothetical protein VND64_06660 [Pirellulales bacterium]|nr:hypothetical protein [Pirellulales bacterium]